MKTLRLVLTLFFAFLCAGLHAQNKELPLHSGDKIGLQISGVSPEDAAAMNHIYPIGEDGTISIQHIERVTAAGVKPSELARKIEELFKSKEIYSRPSVTVSIDATGITDRVVYISGEVARPSPIVFRSGISVSKAITSAGGPSPYAKMKKVKLKRKGQTVRTLDLSKAGSADGDVLVEPEDEIVVPN